MAACSVSSGWSMSSTHDWLVVGWSSSVVHVVQVGQLSSPRKHYVGLTSTVVRLCMTDRAALVIVWCSALKLLVTVL